MLSPGPPMGSAMSDGNVNVQLAGPRALAVGWPDALVPLGPYTALPSPAPKTIHYLDGPVPWVDVRKVSIDPPIRLYLGHTLAVPDDGVGWEVRPAFSAFSISIDRPTAPGTLVNHDCNLLLDVPVNFESVGVLTLDMVITVDFADGEVQVLRIPFDGFELAEFQMRASPTWPGTLSGVLQQRQQAVNAAGTIRWFQDAAYPNPTFAAANTRRSGLLGRVQLQSVARFDAVSSFVETDLVGLLVDGAGTAGQDTFDLQIRGYARRGQ